MDTNTSSAFPLPVDLPKPTPRPAQAPLALSGIRIVDLSRLIAGPFATQMLADLGADVIKIENPDGGDDSRKLMARELGGQSAMYLWTNRNKRSIALDLRQQAARELVRRLVAHADVVVENFSAGVMERFGLSYEALAEINPRIIYCAVSAFGRGGPYASRPGYDPVLQAETGLFSLSGSPDQPPFRVGASVVDISTAMMACNAILAALMARERHGIGQRVEAALFDSAIALIGPLGMNYLVSGEDEVRVGNDSKNAEPAGLFACADGEIYVTCANDRTFRKLAEDVFQRPDIAADPDFASYRLRFTHKPKLNATIGACFAAMTRDELLKKSLAAGVPLGTIRSVGESFRSDEMRSQQLLSRIPHPTIGEVPAIASSFKLHGTPLADPVAPPLLGQHTNEVLREVLNLGQEDIDRLRATGAIGAQPG